MGVLSEFSQNTAFISAEDGFYKADGTRGIYETELRGREG
jgi:hypothetical protein